MEINIKGKDSKKIKVIKEKTDPMCLRASIGGEKKTGYYCVVRGDSWEEIEDMLEETLWAFREAKKIYQSK